MSSTQKCPLCAEPDSSSSFGVHGSGYESYYRCRRCGDFIIDSLLQQILERSDSEDKKLIPYLSIYVRQHQEKGRSVRIGMDNWKDFALAERAVSVPHKIDKLLRLIADKTEVAGQRIEIDDQLDAPVINAVNKDEFGYLLDYLRENGYLDQVTGRTARITVRGWQKLEPPIGGGGIPGQCFVAMSFHPSLDPAWTLGIEPAARQCGYKAIRIDKEHHNEKICDRILAEIRKSQFTIADFSRHRQGVYFEAGYALPLGRPVIWTCQKRYFNRTHFDTNHYNHIVWTDPEDLKEQLVHRILATVK